jgi:signal transduction histidine kinase
LEHFPIGSPPLTLGDGTQRRHFDLVISPVYNHWGRRNGRTITLRDITYRVLAEQKALELAIEQEKANLLRRFLDTASHDLNTPLTTPLISSGLSKRYTMQLAQQLQQLSTLLIQSEPTLQSQCEHLQKLVTASADNGERMEASVLRLQRLVQSMLEAVRFDQQPTLELLVSDLNRAIDETLSQARATASERQITLRFAPDPNLPVVRFDWMEIQRVIKHLVDNALTYTGANGLIEVKTYVYNDSAAIEVCDTGIGIAAADLPYLFERFFRADVTRSLHTGGMGLGLAVVKKIVTAHAGQVEVESTPHIGSTFRVLLPLQ